MYLNRNIPHLYCLHGNLQEASVWEPFENAFHWGDGASGLHYPFKLRCPNLWDRKYSGFKDWSNQFRDKVRLENRGKTVKPFLLGYSLGGRLALQAIVDEPDLWHGAIIISADPGCDDEALKASQLNNDLQWGRRFMEEDQEKVWKDWNDLPLFQWPGKRVGAEFDNSANKINPSRIAHCFDVFSKGRQPFYSAPLKALTGPPLLYLSGEHDSKYTTFGKLLEEQLPKLVKHQIVLGCGHRVPWDNPDGFRAIGQAYLDAFEGVNL